MKSISRLACWIPLVALTVGCATTATRPAAPTAPTAPTNTKPVPSGFTILQINDTYKIEGLRAGAEGGMARVRTLRKQIEAEGRPVLLLHAGDFLFPSVMSKYLKGAPMVDALNRLDGKDGFDERFFVTPGNHEFDNSDLALLASRIDQSQFGWISSNIAVTGPAGLPETALLPLSSRFPNVRDHVVLDLGGIRVGIFGLTLDDQKRPWVDYGYGRERRRATVDRVLGDLEREGAQFVVGLTHQEIGDDLWLAAEFPGRIDWIVGGHEHVALAEQVGITKITKADADAKSAYRIDVGPAPAGASRPYAGSATRIELDTHVPVDPEMMGEVAKSLVSLERAVEEKSGRKLLDVVATTEHLLEGTEPAIRGRETALGDLLCDILRQRLGADIAMVNGGAIRVNDDVAAGGNLRVYELEGIFYYDDRPVVFELRGAELLELLRKSVSQATLGHGRFLQVGGLRFRYHVAPDGSTSIEPVDVSVQIAGSAAFEPLDLSRTYRAATLDYTWRNGYRDGYPLFSAGDGKTSPPLLDEPEISWRRLTEEALSALPGRRITQDLDGRIERRDSSPR